MRQERIQKTPVRRRPRDVEPTPLTATTSGAPDVSDAEDVLELIDQVLAAA